MIVSSRRSGRVRKAPAASRAADLRTLPASTLRHLHAAGRTVIVQPYLDGVDVRGETALIYIDGTFSHAVTKGAMLPRAR